MSFDGIQVESAGLDVPRYPKQEQQISLSEGPAHEVHEADAESTSPAARTSLDSPLIAEKGVLHELPPGSTDLSQITLVEPMTPSELDSRVLGKASQPPSASHYMAGGGNQAEDRSLHHRLVLTLDRLEEVLSKLSASPVVNASAITPEAAMIAPDDPTPPGYKSHSTTSATPKKWKHCPSLVPYLKGATLQNPLSDLDLQEDIRAKTGYAPSRPTIRKHIQKLVDEGKIKIYAKGRDGNLIAYPDRRTTLKPFIVWRGEKSGVPQPAHSDSPEPGGGDGTKVGSGSHSSPGVCVGTASNPRPQMAGNEVPPKINSFARLLRRLGSRKTSTQTAE